MGARPPVVRRPRGPARVGRRRPDRGPGPGRSRATASGALRKAAAARVTTERRASRAVLRLVVLASIAVLLAVTLVPTLRSYLRQQGEIDALRQDVASQRADVADAAEGAGPVERRRLRRCSRPVSG